MNTAIDARIEAGRRYNPRTLAHYVTRETCGTVIVDRTRAIQNTNDERLFCVALNKDYHWSYRDFEHVTIYFDTDGEKVIGGVYNTRTKERETQRVIVTEWERTHGLCYHYIYHDDTLKEIVGAIQNAQQRTI